MIPKTWLRGVLDAAASSEAAFVCSVRLSSSRLRVLAYHGIVDVAGFRRQAELIAERLVPVGPKEVVDSLKTSRALPDRCVWVTFDDGDPTVVDLALPILREFGIPATLFVCPSVIDTQYPYWWQIVDAALDSGVDLQSFRGPPASLPALKSMPDHARRSMVEHLRRELEERNGASLLVDQLSSAALSKWLEAGMTVGNHTWDHPILSECSEQEQERQIVDAHTWLLEKTGRASLFAYPNGGVTSFSRALLDSLGYDIAVAFDHRTASNPVSNDERLFLSRLRTNADGNLGRFRAVVSGFHPLTLRLRSRL